MYSLWSSTRQYNMIYTIITTHRTKPFNPKIRVGIVCEGTTQPQKPPKNVFRNIWSSIPFHCQCLVHRSTEWPEHRPGCWRSISVNAGRWGSLRATGSVYMQVTLPRATRSDIRSVSARNGLPALRIWSRSCATCKSEDWMWMRALGLERLRSRLPGAGERFGLRAQFSGLKKTR